MDMEKDYSRIDTKGRGDMANHIIKTAYEAMVGLGFGVANLDYDGVTLKVVCCGPWGNKDSDDDD